MAQFSIAHKLTSVNEGGYVNNQYDKGGETYRGISRKFHPNWPGWAYIDDYQEIQKLKRNEYIVSDILDSLVDDFYKEKFWDSNKLSLFENQDIANELFDTGVNMGRKFAAKALQEAINLLNRDQKDYRDIEVDGYIGSATLFMINNHKYPKAVLRTINGIQFTKYVTICKKDPSQENNFRGWLKRV